MCPLDPKVERIVEEEIGEDRADYAPLRGSTQPLNDLAVFFHIIVDGPTIFSDTFESKR